MEGLFFSVIIPALNEEHYIPQLLEDLVQQTAHIFEVIVVDASSDDATRAKCHQFSTKLPLSILISSKRNVALQKNIGAERAKGQYLIFIDADGHIGPTFNARLQRVLTKHPASVLLPKVLPSEHTHIDTIAFNLINYCIWFLRTIGKPSPTPGCLIFRKSFFHNIGGFDEKLVQRSGIGEDHEILLRSKKAGGDVAQTFEATFYFSLRRMQKEGRITVLRKYLASAYSLLRTGTIESKLFEYEMGGHNYPDQNSHTVSKGK